MSEQRVIEIDGERQYVTPKRMTVCVDLNGVLDTYTGWRGKDYRYPPREGAREFLESIWNMGYRVCVLTTVDAAAVRAWLQEHDLDEWVYHVTDRKPPAIAYIDDRAICFRGDFAETLGELASFRVHWEPEHR